MNIELSTNITIFPNTLKSIIVEYLNHLGYDTTVDNVSLIVGTKYEGCGPMEREIPYFEKAVVNVKGETK